MAESGSVGMELQDKKPVEIIALITAVCLIGDSMLYVALPTHWQEAGLGSLWEVGVILSVNRFVRLPLNPVVGYLYKRISARNGILTAAVLAAATTLSYGFIQGFWLWVLVRCIWGLAWTFLRLGAYFTILDFTDDSNRGQYMGRYNGLYRLGSLAGMLAGGFMADVWGLRATALAFGLASLIGIGAAFFGMKKPCGTAVTEPARSTVQTCYWRNHDLVWMLVLGMGTALIYQGIFASMLSYLVQVHNPGTVLFLGCALGAASLGGFLQALRWGWEPWLAVWIGRQSDGRCGRYPALVYSLFAGAGLFMVVSLDMPFALWLAVLLGIQLTATFLTTLVDVIAADAASSASRAKVMILYSLFVDIGAAAGPMLGYFLSEGFGSYAPCWGAAALLLGLAAKFSPRLRAVSRRG